MNNFESKINPDAIAAALVEYYRVEDEPVTHDKVRTVRREADGVLRVGGVIDEHDLYGVSRGDF